MLFPKSQVYKTAMPSNNLGKPRNYVIVLEAFARLFDII